MSDDAMKLILLSRDDFDRLNELALLPMTQAHAERTDDGAAVVLRCESHSGFEGLLEVLADQQVSYHAVEQEDWPGSAR